MMNRLEAAYRLLPNKAATVAVNFSKERFRQQNWLGNTTQPWKKRKKEGKRDRGRAILVKSGNLKRDVHKIFVNQNSALICTSKLTGGYAKAHNEGFRGTVTIKEHKRHVFTNIKEKYRTWAGNELSRCGKTIDSSKPAGTVKAHKRKVNLVMRKFLGASPIMDKQIQRMMTAELMRAMKG